MTAVLDAFVRSLVYCLHPRVIGWSLLPFVLMVGIVSLLGYWYLDGVLAGVTQVLETMNWLQVLWGWLESVGAGKLKTVLVPLVVIVLLTPVVLMASLFLVALLAAPWLVQWVASRRFPNLERAGGTSYLASVAWALMSIGGALLALAVTSPLWFIPPLVLVLPPLIWGWLTYRVMAFDALAGHASADERREIFHRHRWALLFMGVWAGYLGAAPSMIWSLGFMAVAMAPFLVPLSIWLYTLVFVFSALWFAHFCLGALQRLRDERGSEAASRRDRRHDDRAFLEMEH